MPDPLARYHRQMLLPQIGRERQERLATSRALLVGCGALGTVIADALARAGVGTLVVVDRDTVELTNLQRQVLFDEQDAREGTPKAVAAAARLARINSSVEIVSSVEDVTARNIDRLMADAGVVLDGTDNFQTRYLLNDACVKRSVPLIYGGAVGTAGMTMTILPRSGNPHAPGRDAPGITSPCLRCVFPDPPPPGSTPTCDTAGVLGPVVGIVALMQGSEAIKVLMGREADCIRGLREIDPWSGRMRTIDVGGPRSDCLCCAARRFEFLDAAAEHTTSLCGADAVQVASPMASGSGKEAPIDLASLTAKLAAHGRFSASAHLVRGRFDRENDRATGKPIELTVFRDGRAIVKGTTDPAMARTIYARYVGG